jgi:hypothetical protein
MLQGVFHPDDEACATIHDEMYPLVDKLHIVEWSLRKEG